MFAPSMEPGPTEHVSHEYSDILLETRNRDFDVNVLQKARKHAKL